MLGIVMKFILPVLLCVFFSISSLAETERLEKIVAQYEGILKKRGKETIQAKNLVDDLQKILNEQRKGGKDTPFVREFKELVSRYTKRLVAKGDGAASVPYLIHELDDLISRNKERSTQGQGGMGILADSPGAFIARGVGLEKVEKSPTKEKESSIPTPSWKEIKDMVNTPVEEKGKVNILTDSLAGLAARGEGLSLTDNSENKKMIDPRLDAWKSHLNDFEKEIHQDVEAEKKLFFTEKLIRRSLRRGDVKQLGDQLVREQNPNFWREWFSLKISPNYPKMFKRAVVEGGIDIPFLLKEVVSMAHWRNNSF